MTDETCCRGETPLMHLKRRGLFDSSDSILPGDDKLLTPG